jgi:hypothetical protein
MDATKAHSVRAAIHAAFGNLPTPAERTLILPCAERDRAGEESIRRDLAGKPWQSLSAEFLEQRWASFCYLSPTAYRYYLPSLLVGALDSLDGRQPFVHSVLFSLPPSFWHLYYKGRDERFQSRLEAFNDEQLRAVAGFLGLVFEESESLRHLAAQAVRWGWNRVETPASAAVRGYYHRLHTFVYPEPADPQVADLFQQIREAFAATPYPGDNRLCGSDQGDEPAEYAMELRGLRWETVHPELLAHCYAALSFLSAEGFRYFLPAFLLADLLEWESNANPVFHLTYGHEGGGIEINQSILEGLENLFGKKGAEVLQGIDYHHRRGERELYAVSRHAGFTRAERLAIIRYLEYRASDDYERPVIERALAGYWLPSVR